MFDSEFENGTLAILSVGEGDTKVSFDPNKPEERDRAAKVVMDMLKRGYAILVEVGKDPNNGKPLYQRAESFDPDTCEYIIVGVPEPVEERKTVGSELEPTENVGSTTPRKRGRPRTRLKAESTSAVAVARTAGG
jgi:hypothetical protein